MTKQLYLSTVGRVGVPAIVVANDPVRMVLCQVGRFVARKGGKPNSGRHSLGSNGVGKDPHAAIFDKLSRLERGPVAPRGHVAIVDETHVESNGALRLLQDVSIL